MIDRTSTPPPRSWGGFLVLAFIRLVKPSRNQIRQRRNRGFRVRPTSLEIKTCATFGGKTRQIQNALAIELMPLVIHPNLRLKGMRQSYEFVSRPQMKAQGVDDLDLASGKRHFVG